MSGIAGTAQNQLFLERSNPPGVTIIFLFMALAVTGLALISIPVVGISLIFAAWIILGHLPLWSRVENREKKIMVIFVGTLIATLPVSVIRSEVAVLHFAVVVSTLGAAFVLTRDLQTYCRALRWLLWTVLAYVYLYLLMNGVTGRPLEEILPNSSSNGVTSGLVFLQASYCGVRYLLYRKPTFITTVLTLGVCVLGIGRGSIIAGAMILMVNVLSFVSYRYGYRALLVSLTGSLMLVLTAVKYGDEITAFALSNTKIGSGLYDYHRERMIREYLTGIDALTLFTGADYRGTSIEYYYNGNPHNAYIRAHYIFGLPYLLAMLAFPWFFLSNRAHAGRTVYALAMLTIIYLRAATEPILFPTMLDFFFFSTCFALRANGIDGIELPEGTT